MKPKYIAVVAALAAIVVQSALAGSLPEIMTPEELRALRAGQIARAATAQADVAKSETPTLYTGKIIDADSGGYLFKYRNYDPEMNRWTTVDPSGYPDGANNGLYINNSITNAFDPTGKQITLYQKPVAGQLIPQSVHSYIYYTDIYACGGTYNWTGSISGQPEFNPPTWVQGFGHLQSQPGSDNNSARNAAVPLNYAVYVYVYEWWFYQDLLAAAGSYDNSLLYNTIPNEADESYNSNGYIHGILSAVGVSITSDAYTNSIGWSRPIPLSYKSQFKISNGYDICCE
jgi:RHS repeat-associated protein